MYDFLLSEEAKNLKQRAREFALNVPRQLLIDMDADKIQYPTQFVKDLAGAHLLGLRFDKKYGGQEQSWVTEMAVLEEIGVLSMALSCLYSLPSICGEALNTFGTDAQKEKYLKPIISGKKFCAEALTEPRGGSDFYGATTTAVKEGDHYILNGEKRFVVGAQGADVFLVYAKTDKNAPGYKSISLFIVERDMGVEEKYVYGLMGTRGGGAGRLYFKDVQVPAENIILGEGEGGRIFNQMMYPERMTSAAGVIGMVKGSVDVASRYSTQRKAFGQSIKNFQGVSFKIADSLCLNDSARGILYIAANALDKNQDNPSLCRRLVSEAKRVSTENAYKAIDNCMQVMGGIGYSNIYPIEKMLRDVRLASIWTGTSEIMNLIIQHEYYKKFKKKDGLGTPIRNIEKDASEAEAADEKIFE
ncbi:MAG: acyl-CoA dehydrogenase [Promethearchaeia archaeon]|nr:MAG: acyl-CoA dehydrogenase [Candidatus Lokiarchaeia archaeon]